MRGIGVATLVACAGCNLVFDLEPVDGLQHTARFEQRFVGATTVEDRPRGLLAARYLVLDTTSATGYRVEPAEVIDGIVGSLKELPAHVLEVRFDDLAYPSYYDFDVPHLRTASVVLGRAELDAPPADARLRWQSTLTSAWDATDGMKLVACGVWAESNLVDLPPVVGSTLVDEAFPWALGQVEQLPGARFGRLSPADALVLARYRTGIVGTTLVDAATASIDQRGGDVIMAPMIAASTRSLAIDLPTRSMDERVAKIPGFELDEATTISQVRATPLLDRGNRAGLLLGDAGLSDATSVDYGAIALGPAWTETFVAVTFATRTSSDDLSTMLVIGEALTPVPATAGGVAFDLAAPFIEGFVVEGSTLASDLALTVTPGPLTVTWTPDAAASVPDAYTVVLAEQDPATGTLTTRASFHTAAPRLVVPGELVVPGTYALTVYAIVGLPDAAAGDLTTYAPARAVALTTSPLFVVGPS